MEELSGAGEVILKSPLEIFSGIFRNFPTNTEYQTRKSHISKISRISRREKKISIMIWFTFGGKI